MTFERLLRLACLAVATWLFAALALVATVHLDDGYRLNHVSGAWMALAQYAADGTLYPPLYDGERFGGTRFMPLQFLVHGSLSQLTGEYVVSGKLLALAAGAALLGATGVVLRKVVGAPTWLSLALAALIVPTQVGLTAITSIRGDVLPLVLQLAAVALVARSHPRGAVTVAALLCAAAVLCKLTALWAPAAIVVWLAFRDRRRLAAFLATFLLPLFASLLLLELASGGRFSDNVFGLAGSALASPADLLDALTTKPLTLLESDAAAIAVVLPFAIADVVLAWRARCLGLLHASFGAAALMTVALMADIGAVSNHLIDLEVLTVLLVGHLFVEFGGAPLSAVRVLVPVAVLWAALGSYVVAMHPDVREAARRVSGGTAAPSSIDLLARFVPPEADLLAEDARIDVEAHRHPLVLDPFMLLRLLDDHPDWEADLVERVEARDFDRVVLLRDHVRADGSIEVENARWRREHLGRPLVAAIERNYRFRAFAGAYAVYEPAR